MTKAIIVYGHPGCPGVAPVRAMLGQSNIDYTYINIRQNADAATTVRAINNGNESVPTLVFPDGSTLTEPTAGELKIKLEALGYRVSPLAWLLGNAWKVIMILVILWALLRFFEIF